MPKLASGELPKHIGIINKLLKNLKQAELTASSSDFIVLGVECLNTLNMYFTQPVNGSRESNKLRVSRADINAASSNLRGLLNKITIYSSRIENVPNEFFEAHPALKDCRIPDSAAQSPEPDSSKQEYKSSGKTPAMGSPIRRSISEPILNTIFALARFEQLISPSYEIIQHVTSSQNSPRFEELPDEYFVDIGSESDFAKSPSPIETSGPKKFFEYRSPISFLSPLAKPSNTLLSSTKITISTDSDSDFGSSINFDS